MRTIKYPSTPHLPWTDHSTSDDKILQSLDAFIDKRVIVTEKMDGENTTMYHNIIHARSMDSVNHPSRNWVKNFWGSMRHRIPLDIRVCGENCYAKHSIHYTNLKSYFLGFNVWRENMCLSWDETLDIFKNLGIISVPVLYDGTFDIELIQGLMGNPEKMEGYVVRVAGEFNVNDFPTHLAKYVRKNHVQTSEHWMKQPVIPNILSEVIAQ